MRNPRHARSTYVPRYTRGECFWTISHAGGYVSLRRISPIRRGSDTRRPRYHDTGQEGELVDGTVRRDTPLLYISHITHRLVYSDV